LPDFDDIEAEDAARQHVLAFPVIDVALAYCLQVQDMSLASQLVLSRHTEIDGDAYGILTPLADALMATHPLAAVLLWRAMIEFALTKSRSGRYGHAARHLTSCATADMAIPAYDGHPTHVEYLNGLKTNHARKASFWERVADLG
jgi:hypothetical protein